jgi:hypothetical protein
LPSFYQQLFLIQFCLRLVFFWSSSLAFFKSSAIFFSAPASLGTSTGDFNSPLSLSKSLSSSWIFRNQS